MAWQTGEWDKAIGLAGTQVRLDNPNPLLPIDHDDPGFCPCDGTMFRGDSGPGETMALHRCGLSPEWFTLAGDSAFTPVDEFDVVGHYMSLRAEPGKTKDNWWL